MRLDANSIKAAPASPRVRGGLEPHQPGAETDATVPLQNPYPHDRSAGVSQLPVEPWNVLNDVSIFSVFGEEKEGLMHLSRTLGMNADKNIQALELFKQPKEDRQQELTGSQWARVAFISVPAFFLYHSVAYFQTLGKLSETKKKDAKGPFSLLQSDGSRFDARPERRGLQIALRALATSVIAPIAIAFSLLVVPVLAVAAWLKQVGSYYTFTDLKRSLEEKPKLWEKVLRTVKLFLWWPLSPLLERGRSNGDIRLKSTSVTGQETDSADGKFTVAKAAKWVLGILFGIPLSLVYGAVAAAVMASVVAAVVALASAVFLLYLPAYVAVKAYHALRRWKNTDYSAGPFLKKLLLEKVFSNKDDDTVSFVYTLALVPQVIVGLAQFLALSAWRYRAELLAVALLTVGTLAIASVMTGGAVLPAVAAASPVVQFVALVAAAFFAVEALAWMARQLPLRKWTKTALDKVKASKLANSLNTATKNRSDMLVKRKQSVEEKLEKTNGKAAKAKLRIQLFFLALMRQTSNWMVPLALVVLGAGLYAGLTSVTMSGLLPALAVAAVAFVVIVGNTVGASNMVAAPLNKLPNDWNAGTDSTQSNMLQVPSIASEHSGTSSLASHGEMQSLLDQESSSSPWDQAGAGAGAGAAAGAQPRS